MVPRTDVYLSGSCQERGGTLQGGVRAYKEGTVYKVRGGAGEIRSHVHGPPSVMTRTSPQV